MESTKQSASVLAVGKLFQLQSSLLPEKRGEEASMYRSKKDRGSSYLVVILIYYYYY